MVTGDREPWLLQVTAGLCTKGASLRSQCPDTAVSRGHKGIHVISKQSGALRYCPCSPAPSQPLPQGQGHALVLEKQQALWGLTWSDSTPRPRPDPLALSACNSNNALSGEQS